MFKSELVRLQYADAYWPYAGFRVGTPTLLRRLVTENLGWNTRNQSGLPGYRHILEEHGNAVTNRDCTFHNWGVEPAIWLQWRYGRLKNSPFPTGTEVTGQTVPVMLSQVPNPRELTASEASTLGSDAAAKFRQAVEERVQTFGGPVFLAELEETREMIVRPAKGLRKKISKYLKLAELAMLQAYEELARLNRRKRRGRKFELIKEIENLWLGARLGILPLMADIDDALATFRDYSKDVALKVRKSVSREFGSRTGIFESLFGKHIWVNTLNARCSIVGEIGANIVAPAGTAERVAQCVGADWHGAIERFVPTLWEAIPYSFVVDYFSNLGAVVDEAFSAELAMKWTSTTLVTTSTRRISEIPIMVSPLVQGFQDPSTFGEIRSNGHSWHEKKSISRRSGLPTISFHLEVPRLLQSLNVAGLLGLLSKISKLGPKL